MAVSSFIRSCIELYSASPVALNLYSIATDLPQCHPNQARCPRPPPHGAPHHHRCTLTSPPPPPPPLPLPPPSAAPGPRRPLAKSLRLENNPSPEGIRRAAAAEQRPPCPLAGSGSGLLSRRTGRRRGWARTRRQGRPSH